MKGRLVRAAIVLLLLFVSFPVAQAVDAPAFVQANCYATAGGAVHLEWTDTADTFTLYYHTTDVFAEATTGTVTSATSLTYTPPLTNQNLYFWVEATEGEDTAVSTFIQIFVDSQAPAVPSLESPDTESAYVTGSVQVSWFASSDNQPTGSVYYQVSYQKQGASEMFSPQNISSEDETRTRLLTLPTSGTYTWKVRAMDEAGNISDWSSPRIFYVNTGTVTLTSPTDNCVLSVQSGTDIQYSWQPVTGFKYAFNLFEGGTQILTQVIVNEGSYTPSLTYVEGETYQWNVQLHDGDTGYGTASSTWTFTIDNTPPGVPTIIGPSGGDTITDSTPTLSWNAVADASTYDVQVSTSNTFSSTAYAASDLSGTSHTIPAGSALANGTYYWRVQAVDAASNESGWSATASFVVNVPAAPVLQG
ncbi:MAG: Ig-like domain-containing protein, partial [Candidatus Methanofastidiosa archaeon]|nr:Ig-like domain-containing protein [Candidatus Methanofastidiosa archaeon]